MVDINLAQVSNIRHKQMFIFSKKKGNYFQDMIFSVVNIQQPIYLYFVNCIHQNYSNIFSYILTKYNDNEL